jgi:hypothetical protein
VPRPTTKTALIEAAESGFFRILEFVEDLPETQRDAEFGFEDRDRTVRDVVFHLVAWHRMMLRWYAEGMADATPAIPAAGYTWRTLPALNQVIWQDARPVPLADALAAFRASHDEVMALVRAHDDEDLFTKRRYPWTGSTSLGAYLVSSTSSHYDWAMAKLRRARKAWAT